MKKEFGSEKWNSALRFILTDLADPKEDLRDEAHSKEFFYEYLWIRDQLIEHAHTLWK